MIRIMDKRDDTEWDYEGDGGWWYSPTAVIIKWAVLGVIVLLFFVYMFGGYYHAKKRAARGLAPLAYHRWLLPHEQRARLDPTYRRPHNNFTFYQAQRYDHNMDTMPPPAYNADHAPPPSYQPPAGASKADPAQHFSGPPQMDGPSSSGSGLQSDAPPYQAAAPTVPPPAHVFPSTNPFR
ncbi:MAG: hypothetical protein M4579_001883 [Chaenotheca gracillima]|nr:MAG: hypothetical protein M4579_001883 [Chaenotheca gracillima]